MLSGAVLSQFCPARWQRPLRVPLIFQCSEIAEVSKNSIASIRTISIEVQQKFNDSPRVRLYRVKTTVNFTTTYNTTTQKKKLKKRREKKKKINKRKQTSKLEE